MAKRSPEAAEELRQAVVAGDDVDEDQGKTDCPEGCEVEPDGECPHGYESAALTMGVI